MFPLTTRHQLQVTNRSAAVTPSAPTGRRSGVWLHLSRRLGSVFQVFRFPAFRSQASALRPPRKASGFTLIELLVVIAIIAILAGLGFPAVQGALQSGKKAQALNDLQQITMAVRAFELEYGRLPTVDGQAEFSADNDKLMNVLRGTADAGSQLEMNPRRVAFIEPKIAKGLKGGIGSDGKFYDPWGTPYKILLDENYDNKIDNFYSSGAGFPTLNFKVIAASAGPDTAFGDGNKDAGTAKDDILSWQ
jgi:prepilin-type N-terminal cleavage/methylation domain-containing protein